MNTNKPSILFLLKQRLVYSEGVNAALSSGLHNSAQFVADMLSKEFSVHLEQVFDANVINKWATIYKPDYIIIEAIWVTPDKLKELVQLHPYITWIVRLHSNIVFLANEGIAIDWLKQYDKIDNVYIAVNHISAEKALSKILNKELLYFPNYYHVIRNEELHNRKCCKGIIKLFLSLFKYFPKKKKEINFASFGAIRPLKNQLMQAIASMEYANKNKLILNFHINYSRVEQKGENVLKNIRNLFKGSVHNLVEHDWLCHKDFVELVKTMDLGLQISLTETYNIVTADFVNNYIPVVTSKEITFVDECCHTSTTDVNDIVKTIEHVLNNKICITKLNHSLLHINALKAKNNIISIFYP